MKRTSVKLLVLSMAFAACKGSSSAKKAPYYGTPELSDFGEKNYIINSTEELEKVTSPSEIATHTNTISNIALCNQTLSEEQLYNPYRNLSFRPTNWVIEKNIADVDYQLKPTQFSHIRVDYWSKGDGVSDSSITRQVDDCFVPAGWKTRSPKIELGVHPFLKKYTDCLAGGLPDTNAIDDCQDGYESIGGFVHRIKSTVVNRHRFRVSWWLQKPSNFEYETFKVKEDLRIPYRIPLEFESIYSELSENDSYRVKAIAFSEESAPELPNYWLIADDQGPGREFLPLNPVELSNDNLDARSKIKEIIRADRVANFAGHFAWDRYLRVQRKSSQIPFSRFFDDQTLPLFKKLRNGTRLKAYIIFKARDLDDVFLEEFILDREGNLTFKNIKQLNAYGMTSLGLPDSTRDLDPNGLEIYND
ncbi:MAG: hypothetical protein R3A80_11255 [Bdellovibrionota bacterium]